LKKIAIYLLIIAIYPMNFLFCKEFSIGSNPGISLPLGNFKDIKELYKNCNQNKNGNNKVIIENSEMNNSIYYDLVFSYQPNKFFKFNAIINNIKNEISGIKVETTEVDSKSNQLIASSKRPEFQSTNLSLGFDINFLTFDKFSLIFGIEPQICFLNFNTFVYSPAVPDPYFIEREKSKTSLGLGIKLGAEYELFQDIKLNISGKYLTIFTDYNHEALSIAYFCYPINDYYTNPKYIIITFGIKYNVF
jgi:hypothetical protein